MDNGVNMDKKEKIQKIATQLKIIYAIITNKSNKEDKKDYKYSNEWEEILKGNDYY